MSHMCCKTVTGQCSTWSLFCEEGFMCYPYSDGYKYSRHKQGHHATKDTMIPFHQHTSAFKWGTGSTCDCRQALPKAEQQPASTAVQDPNRPTPPGVVVVPIIAPQPHTDTTALFQSSGLIRNKAALTAIGDSCGCMEYGYTRSGHTLLQVVTVAYRLLWSSQKRGGQDERASNQHCWQRTLWRAQA